MTDGLGDGSAGRTAGNVGPQLRQRRSGLGALALSIALHALLVILIGSLAIGSFSTRHRGGDDVALVLAAMPETEDRPTFPTVNAAPIPDLPAPVNDDMARRLADRLTVDTPVAADRIADRLRDRLATGATPTTATASPVASGSLATVSFIGVKAENASSVAYVVDASGSLIGTLPIVLDELSRSLARLGPEQRFAVVFFQKNSSLIAPNGDGLQPATPKAISEIIAWARANVRPAGRSNPLVALETALGWKPDVVFLLATSITGSGDFEISRADLLTRLDAMNPTDASGDRTSRIRCIQFLDPDPLDTLRLIAERHGGANGFRFFSREELGLKRDTPSGKSPGRTR